MTRRELAVYTAKDELMYYTWVDEADVESFSARTRGQGFRVVDVQLAGKFERAEPHKKRNPTDRLRHILGDGGISGDSSVTRDRT